MKNNLLLFILILCSNLLIAQSGSVYYFLFNVDPELTDYSKTEDKSRTWFSGWSESEAMPQQLIDSITQKTEERFTAKLGMPVKCCYRKNKKGENFGSVGVFGDLEGLPFNTFSIGKKACPASTRYISLSVQLYSSGGTSVITANKKSKLKPKLQITAKVFDENKVKIWQKKVVLKDFKKLRSVTKYYGTVEVTNSQVLNPYDIYAMYLTGLDKLMLD
jgi:hypothetical protein